MKKYGGSKKMCINMALLAVLVLSLGYYIYQGSILQEGIDDTPPVTAPTVTATPVTAPTVTAPTVTATMNKKNKNTGCLPGKYPNGCACPKNYSYIATPDNKGICSYNGIPPKNKRKEVESRQLK